LEGVVVGLDALADRLLQVPLLHTLDPQILEAVDAAVWTELSLIEAIPAVFPHKLMGVRPVRGILGDQRDANCPWSCIAIDLDSGVCLGGIRAPLAWDTAC
jgi:hypothetical protein